MKKVNFPNLILFLPVSLLYLFVTSCNEESVEIPVQDIEIESAIVKIPFISAENAAKIGVKAVTHLKYGDNVVNSRAGEFVVKEVRKYPEASRSNDKYCYLINFEEGGYAVVAPNGEVLAMNDEGAFSPEENEADDYFMQFASNYVETLSLEPEPVPFDSTEIINPDPAFIWHNGHRCGIKNNHTVYVNIPKLLNTCWDQDWPYNDLCPIPVGSEEPAPTGCVPLAAAQIMTYHKKPASYNGHTYHWDLMDVDYAYGETARNDAAHLCRQLGIEAGTIYKVDGSSTIMAKMKSALTKFGYYFVKLYQGYSEEIILNEINNNHPIVISASGTGTQNGLNFPLKHHAWVIDGAYQYYSETIHTNLDTNQLCYSTSKGGTYFHCNWGWGMNTDSHYGYYLSKVFDPYADYQRNYDQDFQIIYNIY